jgi:hypothetical protein
MRQGWLIVLAIFCLLQSGCIITKFTVATQIHGQPIVIQVER